MSKFVDRYRHGAEWDYDHPLERRALERGCGIIVWQEQVVQLLSDVSGMKHLGGRRDTPRLRPTQQRPLDSHAPAPVPGGGARQRRPR